jgi:hypothetical protein
MGDEGKAVGFPILPTALLFEQRASTRCPLYSLKQTSADAVVGDGGTVDALLTKTSSIYLAGKAPS